MYETQISFLKIIEFSLLPSYFIFTAVLQFNFPLCKFFKLQVLLCGLISCYFRSVFQFKIIVFRLRIVFI